MSRKRRVRRAQRVDDLPRPTDAQPHPHADDRPRQPGFPEKDNGLIVDYVGVFRNLEKALAIYGAANAEAGVDTPIQDIDALAAELEAAIDIVVGLCTDHGVDLIALRDANGFAHIALRDSAVEALLDAGRDPHHVSGGGAAGAEAVQSVAA